MTTPNPNQPPAPGASGGPTETPIPGATLPDPTATPDPTSVKKQPVYQGVKVCETPEEHAAYTAELERKLVEAQLRGTPTPPTQTMTTTLIPTETPSQKSPEEEIETLLFEKPAEAVKKIKELAKTEIRQELERKDTEHNFWETFYKEHPDLKNAERVVQSIVREKWGEIAKLPLAEAKKILATDSRAVVDMIRGGGGSRTEVPNSPAATLPASGGVPQTKPVVQDEPLNFVAQVKKFQRRA